jgi:hypothetical protein
MNGHQQTDPLGPFRANKRHRDHEIRSSAGCGINRDKRRLGTGLLGLAVARRRWG